MAFEQYREIAGIVGVPIYVLLLVLVWSMIWKGLALWKAAQNKSLSWFIAILVINTLGILEVLYIFGFSKMNEKKVVSKKKSVTRK